MNHILNEVRHALRQFRRAPAVYFTAVITLALGIGTSTAVFSVIDAVLLRPLPFSNQDRLVSVQFESQRGPVPLVSYPDYLDIRSRIASIPTLAAYTSWESANLETGTVPVSLHVVRTTDNFFDLFGTKPLIGRGFEPGEDQPERNSVVVLSYNVWQRYFNGRADVIGTSTQLDGFRYRIVGVMPKEFRFPLSFESTVYTPLKPNPQWIEARGTRWLVMLGLRGANVTTAQANADLIRIVSILNGERNSADAIWTAKTVSLTELVNGRSRAPLNVLSWLSLTLLAIACVNVSGLLLAHSVRREKEVAVKAALGASRWRMLRPLLVESAVITTISWLVGIGCATGLLTMMHTFLVKALPRGLDVRLNASALGVALLLAMMTSFLAGLAPGFRRVRVYPRAALTDGRGGGARRWMTRLRQAFLVTQVALLMVLLSVSSLLVHHLRYLLGSDFGFVPKRILTVQLSLSPGDYKNRDPLTAFFQPVIDRVSRMPGVSGAAVVNCLPLSMCANTSAVHVEGQPPTSGGQGSASEIRFVSAGYFDAMGIDVVRGRKLTPALDTSTNAAATIVVNQAFGRKFFADGNPVGATLDQGFANRTSIVGMVKDTQQGAASASMPEMDLLIDEFSAEQRLNSFSSLFLVVGTTGNPALLISPVREAVHAVDPRVPFQNPETLDDVLRDTLVFQRMQTSLVTIFATLALMLTLVGIYGAVRNDVEFRTRDIGVQMALGASQYTVVMGMVRQNAQSLAVGIVGGWLLVGVLQKALAAVISYHLTWSKNGDFVFLFLMGIASMMAGLCASLPPALRATQINPVEALRAER